MQGIQWRGQPRVGYRNSCHIAAADLMTRADITDTEDPFFTVSEREKEGRESGRCQDSLGGGLPPTELHCRVTFVFSNTSIVSLWSSSTSPRLSSSLMTRWLGGLLTTRLLRPDTKASRALNLLGVTLHCQSPSSNSSSASLMRREQSPELTSPAQSYLPGKMPSGTPSLSHLEQTVNTH